MIKQDPCWKIERLWISIASKEDVIKGRVRQEAESRTACTLICSRIGQAKIVGVGPVVAHLHQSLEIGHDRKTLVSSRILGW